MEISVPSILACSFSLTILTCILYIILKKDQFISKIDIFTVYLIGIFIIVRSCLPFDFYYFHLTHTFFSDDFLPFLQNIGRITIDPLQNNDKYQITISTLILFVWFSVAGILFVMKLAGFISYQIKLCKIYSPSSPQVSRIFSDALQTVFPKTSPNCTLIKLNTISTPASFGIIHHYILLPDIDFSEKELYCIFVHELLHIKNHDVAFKLLLDLSLVIHWWNIFIFKFLPGLLHHVQELYVDYWVSHYISKEEKACYLSGIHKTLKYTQKYMSKNVSAGTLCTFSSNKQIIQRFSFILNPCTRYRSLPAIITMVFLFVLSFSYVIEPFNLPDYDENGENVFYMNDNNSFFIFNNGSYDLYVDGEYMGNLKEIPDTFMDLPVYSNPK